MGKARRKAEGGRLKAQAAEQEQAKARAPQLSPQALRKAQRAPLAALGLKHDDLKRLQAAKQGDAAGEESLRPRRGGEFAPTTSDTYEFGQQFVGFLRDPDPHHTQDKAKDQQFYKGPYSQYEEQLDKDAHLAACWGQRIGRCLSKARSYQPADTSPLALDIASFIEAACESLPGWRDLLKALLWGAYYGFAAPEIIWPADLGALKLVRYVRRSPSGKRSDAVSASREALLPVKLEGRHPRRFRFGLKGELRLLTITDFYKGVEVPPLSFVVHTPDPRFGNPYGVASARNSWWWSKFKTDGIRFLLVFAEKYATGTPVLTYPKGTTSIEKAEYLKIITSLEQETGLAVPEGVAVAMLEMAGKAGSANAYQVLLEYCDKQLSKLILGETMTIEEGKHGNQAIADVHLQLLDDLIRDDAAAVTETLNRTLIPWLVDINFGPAAQGLYPLLKIETDKTDVKAALEKFKGLFDLNVPLSLRQVRDECNAEIPDDEADTLNKPAPLPPVLAPGGPGGDKPPAAGEKPKAQRAGASPAPPKLATSHSPIATAAPGRASARIDLRLYAAAEQIPDEELRKLLAEGIAASAALTAGIPELVRAALLAYATQLLGEGAGEQPIPAGLAALASQYTLPEELTKALVEQLNNDLTEAGLHGSGVFADALKSAGLPLPVPAPGAAPAAENALASELFSSERLVPTKVLEVFQSRAATALTHEDFYKLDALARGQATTVWQTAQGEIVNIMGFVEDAIREGHTVQQFADRVYDELRARYSTGEEFAAWHVETIYHTNIAHAFNTEEMDGIWGSKDLLPWIMFVNPSPQYAVCVASAGKVWRTDVFATLGILPPLHFNCGSSIAALGSADGHEVHEGPPLDENGNELKPMEYAGPIDRNTGQPVGIPARFGAWAPLDARVEHLKATLGGTA